MELLDLQDSLTPEMFFEEILPDSYQDYVVKMPPNFNSMNLKINYNLRDQENGIWQLKYTNGQLLIDRTQSNHADITFIQTSQDWHDGILCKKGANLGKYFNFFLTGRYSEELFHVANRISQEKKRRKPISGTLKITIMDNGEIPWDMYLIIGNNPKLTFPDVSVKTTEKDISSLLNGQASAIKTLLTGKVKVRGNIGLLLSVVTLFI